MEQIIFTAPPDTAEKLIAAVEETGTSVTVIGEILPVEQGRRLVLPDGQEVPLEPSGWQHFRSV